MNLYPRLKHYPNRDAPRSGRHGALLSETTTASDIAPDPFRRRFLAGLAAGIF